MKTDIFIPLFFGTRRLWVLWKKELASNGRETKVPYSVSGFKASTTNPETWSTLRRACDALQAGNYSGLGVVMAKDLNCVFIDIDHCIDSASGELSEVALDILSHFPKTYAEISQSGEGIHIFARGSIPRDFKNSKAGVEMYSSGRYCAFTAHAIQPYEVNNAQIGLDYVFEKYKTPEARKIELPKGECLRSDEDVIKKAMERDHFRNLYYGKWEGIYPSQSEADFAFCSILAFWADRDEEVIDRIFRSSNLYRMKWDEMHGSETYGVLTIRKACAAVTESCSEWRKKRTDEINKYILSKW